MAANPNRFIDDGFNLSYYFANNGLDTVEQIRASINSMDGQGDTIPIRIVQAIQAAAQEIQDISERAKAATGGAVAFNGNDAAVGIISTGLAFIPVVGTALGGLVGLLGGKLSGDQKNRRAEAIASDANKIIAYWQQQIIQLQALAKQYPVKGAGSTNLGLSGLTAGSSGNSTLLLAGLAVGGVYLYKQKKRKKKG